MNFTQQYGKNRQRYQQNKFYHAAWQLLPYFYRELLSKILSVREQEIKRNSFHHFQIKNITLRRGSVDQLFAAAEGNYEKLPTTGKTIRQRISEKSKDENETRRDRFAKKPQERPRNFHAIKIKARAYSSLRVMQRRGFEPLALLQPSPHAPVRLLRLLPSFAFPTPLSMSYLKFSLTTFRFHFCFPFFLQGYTLQSSFRLRNDKRPTSFRDK